MTTYLLCEGFFLLLPKYFLNSQFDPQFLLFFYTCFCLPPLRSIMSEDAGIETGDCCILQSSSKNMKAKHILLRICSYHLDPKRHCDYGVQVPHVLLSVTPINLIPPCSPSFSFLFQSAFITETVPSGFIKDVSQAALLCIGLLVPHSLY